MPPPWVGWSELLVGWSFVGLMRLGLLLCIGPLAVVLWAAVLDFHFRFHTQKYVLIQQQQEQQKPAAARITST